MGATHRAGMRRFRKIYRRPSKLSIVNFAWLFAILLIISVEVLLFKVAFDANTRAIATALSPNTFPAIISAASTLPILVTVLFIQWKDAREGRSREILYRILTSLAENRAYIEAVLELENKPFDQWTADDRIAARHVCTRFHIIAWLVDQKMIPAHILASVWYYSLPQCYDILKPYIDDIRSKRGQNYWIKIDEMVLGVLELNRHRNPSATFDHAGLAHALMMWRQRKLGVVDLGKE